MVTKIQLRGLFDPTILRQATWDAFVKLSPRHQVRNPVMFTVYIGSILTSILFFTSCIWSR